LPAPASPISCEFDLEIREGNIDLDPTSSTNFDLGVEYYFTRAGILSAGLFYKDMRDNIYTARENLPGDFISVSRANADSAWVRGIELGYDQQFTFLPAPFDGLGAFVNYTYADSEVDTGLDAFKDVTLPLFNQVENTLNAGLFYDKGGFRSRISVLYRSESLIDIATDASTGLYDPKLSRYLGDTTTLDITASYTFARHWQVFTEFSNVLDEEGTAYNGDESRPDYYELTGWTGLIGLRWNL
jgi:TonB-dependent receptor